jgi:hypothetical protein
MVRANEVSEADIWPCSAGVGVAVSAKRSRSLRREADWRSAELKRAFCLFVRGQSWVIVSRVVSNGSRTAGYKPW